MSFLLKIYSLGCLARALSAPGDVSGAAGPVGAGDHLRVGSGGHEGAVPSRPGCPVAQCPSPPAALCPFLPGDRGSSHFAPWGGEGFCAHYPDAHLDRSAWQSLQAPGCINSGPVVTQFRSPQEIGWTVQGNSRLDAQEGLSLWEPAWWPGGDPGSPRWQQEAHSHPRAVLIRVTE